MVDIIINENFEEKPIFEVENFSGFDFQKIFKMRMDMEKISSNEIDKLLFYEMIKGNLTYDLPYQREGAVKLLCDLNATGLLADEVGLGKTITAGMVIKEGIVRGLMKKILVLAPPSLVDQWKAELSEKFEVEFDKL